MHGIEEPPARRVRFVAKRHRFPPASNEWHDSSAHAHECGVHDRLARWRKTQQRAPTFMPGPPCATVAPCAVCCGPCRPLASPYHPVESASYMARSKLQPPSQPRRRCRVGNVSNVGDVSGARSTASTSPVTPQRRAHQTRSRSSCHARRLGGGRRAWRHS